MSQTGAVKVLIAEDSVALASLLARSLMAEGYSAEIAHDGQQALNALNTGLFSLLILDLDLPIIKGKEVLERLRAVDRNLPVLIMTGLADVSKRVEYLDEGADDYLTKPVSLAEVAARVRALLRRSQSSNSSLLRVADLELDRLERKVHRAGKAIELTAKEFTLLEYMMRNSGRQITRKTLIEDVWGLASNTVTNVIDVYINYLRKKVDEGFEEKLINTVRGVGFCFGPQEPYIKAAPEHIQCSQ